MIEKLHIEKRGLCSERRQEEHIIILSWRIPQRGAMMKTKRLLNCHMDTEVVWALEQVAMSMVGHQILELYSAW